MFPVINGELDSPLLGFHHNGEYSEHVKTKKISHNLYSLDLQIHRCSSPPPSPSPPSPSLLSLSAREPTWQPNPLTVADNACWLWLLAAVVDWMRRSAAMSAG